ncbi:MULTISPECIES: hypothetical protein [unclassified Nocardia]|uniref:hypothetical protein n=1 Tax=unclassified Nocardia TaxID=2637762 RepID=UPI00278C14A2|nr:MULTISPECIES: hypothetical protein [unclassified Nocardia]
MLVALGGCGFFGNSTPDGPSEYSQGRLCAEFTEFVKNELSADVEYREAAGDDRPIGYSTGCRPAPSSGPSVGQLVMSRSTEDGTSEPNEPSYEPQNGFDEDVWIAPDNRFRVQIGRWIGTMELYRMELTNEQTRKSIEFLIRETRAVRG